MCQDTNIDIVGQVEILLLRVLGLAVKDSRVADKPFALQLPMVSYSYRQAQPRPRKRVMIWTKTSKDDPDRTDATEY